LNITGLGWKEQGAAVCSRTPTAASARAGNGGRSRGSAKQTTINQKAVAIAAETVLVAAERAAAVAVAAAAAMATAAMVVTTRQPWQR
jgi:hypothetical protein